MSQKWFFVKKNLEGSTTLRVSRTEIRLRVTARFTYGCNEVLLASRARAYLCTCLPCDPAWMIESSAMAASGSKSPLLEVRAAFGSARLLLEVPGRFRKHRATSRSGPARSVCEGVSVCLCATRSFSERPGHFQKWPGKACVRGCVCVLVCHPVAFGKTGPLPEVA